MTYTVLLSLAPVVGDFRAEEESSGLIPGGLAMSDCMYSN